MLKHILPHLNIGSLVRKEIMQNIIKLTYSIWIISTLSYLYIQVRSLSTKNVMDFGDWLYNIPVCTHMRELVIILQLPSQVLFFHIILKKIERNQMVTTWFQTYIESDVLYNFIYIQISYFYGKECHNFRLKNQKTQVIIRCHHICYMLL